MTKGFAAIFVALVIAIVGAKYASNVSKESDFDSPNEAWVQNKWNLSPGTTGGGLRGFMKANSNRCRRIRDRGIAIQMPA